MTQAWEGLKHVRDLPADVATPMIRLKDGRDFYVQEPVKCTDGTWFWPQRWILGPQDEMFAEGVALQPSSVRPVFSSCSSSCVSLTTLQNGVYTQVGTLGRRTASAFALSFPEIMKQGAEIRVQLGE